MKRTIKMTTMAPYMEPIPYAHRQDVLATRKPKRNGEMNGDTMKPYTGMLEATSGPTHRQTHHGPEVKLKWIVRIRSNNRMGSNGPCELANGRGTSQ